MSITSDREYFASFDTSSTPPLPVFPPTIPPPSSNTPPPITDPNNSISMNTPPTEPIPPRKSSRIKQSSAYLQDFICPSVTNCLQSSHSILYPIFNYMSFTHLSNPHCRFALFISTQTKPKTYAEASKYDCWEQAMQAELNALEKTSTWKIVDLPPNATYIGCRWVYKIKHHSDGSIERFEARLVAKGYNQIEGLDYFDTYSPIAKLTTIRMILALPFINHWHLHQLDVNNAFLHGDLKEDVYMMLPHGTTSDKHN